MRSADASEDVYEEEERDARDDGSDALLRDGSEDREREDECPQEFRSALAVGDCGEGIRHGRGRKGNVNGKYTTFIA
jgi:hypothetical protein